jgi:hypothetical protein
MKSSIFLSYWQFFVYLRFFTSKHELYLFVVMSSLFAADVYRVGTSLMVDGD